MTDRAIATLVERGAPLVAVLWGRDAQALARHLHRVPVVASAHPSPMSADRRFFGSRPFTRANRLLEAQGSESVASRLPWRASVRNRAQADASVWSRRGAGDPLPGDPGAERSRSVAYLDEIDRLGRSKTIGDGLGDRSVFPTVDS